MSLKDTLWPALIVGILATGAGGTIAMARIAAADPHAAIESDYYRKAVAWDATMAQERANARLGWTLAPTLPALGTARTSPLALAVTDAAGQPVAGAIVHVEAMAVAHADTTVAATLVEDAPGHYVAAVPIRRAGLWELRVKVVRGRDAFTADLRLDVALDVAARPVTARPGDPLEGRVKAGLAAGRAGA